MTLSRIVRTSLWLACGLASLAGCRDQPKDREARLQDALPFLPLPRDPEFVSRNGSADAIQVVLTTPMPLDSTIAYYRAELSTRGWTITGDQPAADAGRTLLATKGRQPLWVMIMTDPAGHGTRVSINGAVVANDAEGSGRLPAGTAPPDSTKPASAPTPAGKPKPKS